MAVITAAAAMSHAPGLTGWPEQANEDSLQRVRESYQAAGELIRQARPDFIIGIANDHLSTFRVDNYPDFSIGLASEHEGPFDWFQPWLKITPYRVRGHAAAGVISNALTNRGVKITRVFDNLVFDDNFSVPLTATGLVSADLPLVPILQNCTIPPVPDQYASYRFGQALRRCIDEDLDPQLRIALLATGGLSHEPGGPKYLTIDEGFDRWFLDLFAAGDHDALLREVTWERMESAGSSGTSEVLSWIALAGALGSQAPVVVDCYEPIREWRCGIGVVHWRMSTESA